MINPPNLFLTFSSGLYTVEFPLKTIGLVNLPWQKTIKRNRRRNILCTLLLHKTRKILFSTRYTQALHSPFLKQPLLSCHWFQFQWDSDFHRLDRHKQTLQETTTFQSNPCIAVLKVMLYYTNRVTRHDLCKIKCWWPTLVCSLLKYLSLSYTLTEKKERKKRENA